MFRDSLDEDRGMLFDFGRSAPVTMWMRNTYIPLDMVFIEDDGTIARIVANTEPLSDAVIGSGGPVRAVLELAAGTSARPRHRGRRPRGPPDVSRRAERASRFAGASPLPLPTTHRVPWLGELLGGRAGWLRF